jgi:hypothetical protein
MLYHFGRVPPSPLAFILVLRQGLANFAQAGFDLAVLLPLLPWQLG